MREYQGCHRLPLKYHKKMINIDDEPQLAAIFMVSLKIVGTSKFDFKMLSFEGFMIFYDHVVYNCDITVI